jgi:CubicO group peptidase (beta-lactamase class C family)
LQENTCCMIHTLYSSVEKYVSKFIIPFLLFYSVSFSAHAQSTRDSLTQLLNDQYNRSGFPGFSVAVVNKDSILYEHAFGYADLEQKIPYTTTTLQPIASVSKLFIGVAIMKAIEQGLFTLNTNINDILPFKVLHPYKPKVPITIKHLVTHTSGIIDDPEIYKRTYVYIPPIKDDAFYKLMMSKGYGATGADTTLAIFLKSYLAADGHFFKKSNFNKKAPGKRYEYSNLASDLAAYLIEVKSGLSFAAYTERYILNPLHMNYSAWSAKAAYQDRKATLYTGQKVPYPLYSSICYPDGGLITSCHDLSIFLKENIAGYQGKGTQLTPASFSTMFQPAFSSAYKPKDVDPDEPNIGVLYTIKKNGIIGHSGSDGGVTSFLYFNPEKGFGMLFIANTELEGLNGINKNLLSDFEKIWSIMSKYGGKINAGE